MFSVKNSIPMVGFEDKGKFEVYLMKSDEGENFIHLVVPTSKDDKIALERLHVVVGELRRGKKLI